MQHSFHCLYDLQFYSIELDTSGKKKEGMAVGDIKTHKAGRTKGSKKDMV